MFGGKLRPVTVQPVEGHVGGTYAIILKPLFLYLELDLTDRLIAVANAVQCDIETAKNKDRLRCLISAETPDNHLGALIRIGA